VKVENIGWEGRGEVCCHVQISEGGSPCLSQLRTNRLTPVSKFDYVLAHTGFMGSRKYSSFVCHRVKRYSTIPHGCSSGSCMGHPWMPVEESHGRRALGWGRTRPHSMIASWTVATHGVFATHMCRLVRWLSLHGFKLAWVSTTLLDMRDSCLLQ
jgi:hypothetical protein